jgi:hypothetical protein
MRPLVVSSSATPSSTCSRPLVESPRSVRSGPAAGADRRRRRAPEPYGPRGQMVLRARRALRRTRVVGRSHARATGTGVEVAGARVTRRCRSASANPRTRRLDGEGPVSTYSSVESSRARSAASSVRASSAFCSVPVWTRGRRTTGSTPVPCPITAARASSVRPNVRPRYTAVSRPAMRRRCGTAADGGR